MWWITRRSQSTTAETGACLSEEGDGSRTVSVADVVHHHALVVRQAGTQAAAINLVVGRKQASRSVQTIDECRIVRQPGTSRGRLKMHEWKMYLLRTLYMHKISTLVTAKRCWKADFDLKLQIKNSQPKIYHGQPKTLLSWLLRSRVRATCCLFVDKVQPHRLLIRLAVPPVQQSMRSAECCRSLTLSFSTLVAAK